MLIVRGFRDRSFHQRQFTECLFHHRLRIPAISLTLVCFTELSSRSSNAFNGISLRRLSILTVQNSPAAPPPMPVPPPGYTHVLPTLIVLNTDSWTSFTIYSNGRTTRYPKPSRTVNKSNPGPYSPQPIRIDYP